MKTKHKWQHRWKIQLTIPIIGMMLSGCCDSLFSQYSIFCGGETFKTTLPVIPDSVSFGSEQSEWEQFTSDTDTYIPSLSLGLGPSFFSGDASSRKTQPRLGFHVGAEWTFPLTDDLDFNPGIFYRSVGSREIEEMEINDPYYHHVYRFEERTRLSYLGIHPVMSLSLSPSVRIAGGPSIAFLLGAKREHTNGSQTFEDESTKGINSLNLGGTIGGYYRPHHTFFEFGVLLGRGFSPLFEQPEYRIPGASNKRYANSAALVVVYNLPYAFANRRNQARVGSPEDYRRREAERQRKYEQQKRSSRARSK